MPPRRFTTFVLIAAVGITTLFLLSTSSRRIASTAVEAVHVPEVVQSKLPSFEDLEFPSIRFSFAKSVHRPPEQPNSTTSDTSWFSDWRWLNPFSSSVTLDEDRAVLPPLVQRPPVYTYYETSTILDKEEAEADRQLLLTWKRAWWAQGFKPIVLTQVEAMSHPLYAGLHHKGMPAVLEEEFTRWLAWGHMGTGLLASWHCVPMPGGDNELLDHLRHGRFEKLTRFQGLGTGLFAGEKVHIEDALKESLNDVKLSTYKDITNAINENRFKVESTSSLAHYDSNIIEQKYQKLAKIMKDEPLKGKQALNKLINAHLHTVWQNTYTSGISVLKPLPAHTSELVKPGQNLAQLLAECPVSILQSSCPPNKPKCSPCVGTKMRIQTAESFKDSPSLFTIATIPHPYTMISLNNLTHNPGVAHIRRHTNRDTWIRAVTRSILGDGRGGPARVIGMKNVIASEQSRSSGLWFTVEHFPADFNAPPPKPKSPTNDMHPEREKVAPFPEHWLEELDWHFGFPIPRTAVAHGESYSPVPGIAEEVKGIPADKKTSYDPPAPTYGQQQKEVDLLRWSRETISSKDKQINRMRAVAEAWNLADTEIWKFARAYRARSIMERKQWEEEEAAYNGPGNSRAGRWW